MIRSLVSTGIQPNVRFYERKGSRSIVWLLFVFIVVNSSYVCAQTWTSVYTPGSIDINGNYYGGTEIMQFAVHKGKLFAGTSYWCESDKVGNPGPCEILRLDSADADWIVDKKDFKIGNERISALRSVIFTSDHSGNEMSPDTLLIAVPNHLDDQFFVYVRDDRTDSWVSDSLLTVKESNASCRDIGFYKDPTNNVCYVFLAVKYYGIIKGAYDPSRPSRIRWFLTPEIRIPFGERIIGFTTCNNCFYAATNWELGMKGHIFRRNDSSQTWQVIKRLSTDQIDDIRGFSTVPNPNSSGELIWYTWDNVAVTLDPLNNYSETVEFSFNDSLTKALGFKVLSMWGPFTANLEWQIEPCSGDSVFFLPIAIRYDSLMPDRANSRNVSFDFIYYERHQKNNNITYVLKKVVENYPLFIDDLVGARMMCISPFPEDDGKVVYAGGYVCYFDKVTKTAWIYRGDFREK